MKKKSISYKLYNVSRSIGRIASITKDIEILSTRNPKKIVKRAKNKITNKLLYRIKNKLIKKL